MINTVNRIIALLAISFAGPALAQSACNAYFPFDGNLNDSGGNGYNGVMLGQDGGTPTPQFTEGRNGQALVLNGTGAMRSLLDLHVDSCPQVTVTAWISTTGERPKGAQYFISTGAGSGPGMSASGNIVRLNGTANGISEADVLRDRGGWTFVAGVYDYTNGLYRFHWRNRNRELPLGENIRPPEDAFWVGAFNDTLSYLASGMAIDDLRIYDKALTVAEIEEVIAGTRAAPGTNPDQAVASIGQQPPNQIGPGITAAPTAAGIDAQIRPIGDAQWSGAACTSHDDCGTGNYCGWDRMCHPESHAPMQNLQVMNVPMELQTVPLAEPAGGDSNQTASGGSPVPVGSPSFTGVAGFDGDNQRRLDMQDKFLHQIGWRDGADIPCKIHVNPTVHDKNTVDDNGLEADYGCGSTPFALFADPDYAVQLEQSVISSIAVCNGLTSQRLKGIRVSGNVVRDDGSVVYEPASDEEALPRCSRWSNPQLCGLGQIATGIVVHTNNRSGENETIVGLQLICRSVALR